jgi:hypothetical protein
MHHEFTYHRCGEGTIKPTTTLTNEFDSLFWHIRFGFTGFDICQGPLSALLRHQLEAKNTI